MTTEMMWLPILVVLAFVDVIAVGVVLAALLDRKISDTGKSSQFDLKFLFVATTIIAVHVAGVVGVCFHHRP
jgi:hypothetical protein